MKLTITQPAAAAAVECGNGGTGRLCDFCEEAPALVYCRADSARLCLACDRLVHAANTVSARHSRSLLCDACISSPATILRGSAPSASGQSHEGQPLLLCSNCDYDALQGDGEISRPAERRVVEPYSGCPTAEEMISLLGVPAEGVKLQFLADDDQDIFADVGGWVWETPPILCVEDLLLPPVSPAGGFPAMGVPPPPKDRNLGCGRHKGEILRQLRGLESDMDSYASFDFNQEAAADAYQAHPLNLPSATGENAWVENQWVLPSTEQLPEIAVDAVEGKALVVGNNAPVIAGERPQPPPLASRSKIPPPDRRLVLSRYKEKRKTRRFDKQIRYESRKARAEGRERIKGRFVKLGRSSVT